MLTNMITYQRSHYNDPNFTELVRQLDEDLKNRYQSYQEKFTSLNKLDAAVKVILAYDGDKAVACGAIRPM
jgi:putative acetyltransferase